MENAILLHLYIQSIEVSFCPLLDVLRISMGYCRMSNGRGFILRITLIVCPPDVWMEQWKERSRHISLPSWIALKPKTSSFALSYFDQQTSNQQYLFQDAAKYGRRGSRVGTHQVASFMAAPSIGSSLNFS